MSNSHPFRGCKPLTQPLPLTGERSMSHDRHLMANPVILIRDRRTTEAALLAARADGTSPILITPEGAASFYGAGYLGALQDRAETEFPDVDFELIVDCADAP